MPYLPPKDKETLAEFGRTSVGEIVRELIQANLDEIASVETLESEPIASRRRAIEHLKTNLLSYFVEKEEVKTQEVETYE